MNIGLVRYRDSLQATIPDFTEFHKNGGKMIHYHGEVDLSVPTPSSVHYWGWVLSVMYSSTTFNASGEALGELYRFFLIPSAAHCASNDPGNNMNTMIAWVENGAFPKILNATVFERPLQQWNSDAPSLPDTSLLDQEWH